MFYTLNTQIYSFYRGPLLENIPKAIIFIPKNNFLYLYPCFSIYYILKFRSLFLKQNFIPDKRGKQGDTPSAKCRQHTTSPAQGFTCKKAVGTPSALTDTQETPPFRRTRIRARPF